MTTERQHDEERGLELAQRLEQTASGESAAVVVFGGTWLLASTIVQAIERQDSDEFDPLRAVEVVCALLGRSVADLMAARQASKH